MVVLRGIPRASSEISKDFLLNVILFRTVDHCNPSQILTLENTVALGHSLASHVILEGLKSLKRQQELPVSPL